MYALRRFANRHARAFAWIYARLETVFVALDPLVARIGHDRVERVVIPVERLTKGLLFDCRMCGQCVLSSTGMICPMTCPKALRNGPCGGVRPGGGCEVEPDRPCVWIMASDGAARMRSDAIRTPLPPVDHALQGRSAWMRAVRLRRARP